MNHMKKDMTAKGFQPHPFPPAFLGRVLSAKEPHTQDLGTLPYSHAPALIQSSNTESGPYTFFGDMMIQHYLDLFRVKQNES